MWAAILIWAGLVLLASNLGLLVRFESLDAWGLIFIGAGLIVNVVLKEHWGHPRPSDLFEFGGDGIYLPPWAKGPAGNGESFPSGHAAIGFSFFAFWFMPSLVRWVMTSCSNSAKAPIHDIFQTSGCILNWSLANLLAFQYITNLT